MVAQRHDQLPRRGKRSVATIGGGLNSFLENFTGQDRDAPQIALYRVWLGSSANNLKALRRATGDGIWGELHDAYFLAEGSKSALDEMFSKLEKRYGKPAYGERQKGLRLTFKPVGARERDRRSQKTNPDSIRSVG